MSLGKGINAWIGFGGETTFGTKGTIDTFSPIISESLRHIKDMFESDNLGGTWADDLYYSAGRNEGSVVFEQTYTGIELFWRNLLGTYAFSVNSPVVGVNTHMITNSAASAPASMSIEAIRGIGGSLERSYLGMYPVKATIEFAPKSAVKTTFDLVGQGVSSGSATSKTFPTRSPVLPAHLSTLTLGGNTLTVLSGSVEIEAPRDAAREHYGAGLYKEAVANDRVAANFSLECEYDNASGANVEQLQQDFENEAKLSGLVLAHQGDIITGTTKEEFAFSSTSAYLSEIAPTAQDNGVIKFSISGRVITAASITFKNATSPIS